MTEVQPSLQRRDGSWCCTSCGRPLAPSSVGWKSSAKLIESPMRGSGGSAYGGGEGVRLRRFFCPGCGTLLDSETAQQGDPFLEDSAVEETVAPGIAKP